MPRVLLEGLYKRGMKQPEVAPALRAGDGILMAWHHEPIAPWQDVAWIEEMRRSLRPYQFLRMIRNEWVTSESAFVEMEWYERVVDAEAGPLVADRGVPVYVGVDASVKRDSTAVVAVTWDAAARKVRLVAHRIFQPTASEPLDFEGTVEWTLLAFRKRYAVREVRYDPYQMAAVAQRLSAAGLPMKEYPQSVPNLTAMGTNLYELIKGGGIVFYPDDAIRLAISRAIAIETPRGWKISKEKASHKVDVVVALAMAALGAVENQSNNWMAAINTPEFLGRLLAMPASRQTFGVNRGRDGLLASMLRTRDGA
jgi:phage terminase large subunit-like protein